MAYPFFSLAKTHRTTPIDYRMNDVAIRVEAVPEHGRDRPKHGGWSGCSPKRTASPTFGHGIVPVQRAVHDGGPDFQHQMSARGDQHICCWAFIRRCSSHCTVLSVTAVEIGSSRRRAVA